jgi:ubiquinone/menaquinone biosynthesis C-methylase UbiE
MTPVNQPVLKQDVKKYWNQAACGTEFIQETKFSREYFEAIEAFRYHVEPEIFAFAQFTRFHGKKVLEVGVGAGTDFLQWVRAGALAHGIDLTEEAITHVHHRLELYNLAAQNIRVGDAENIPHPSNAFDLVYSWGVIHHSPNTFRALQELIRVAKPGGTIKVMIYNRRSLFAVYQYLKSGLLKGKPFMSFTEILHNHQESPGTQAFTFKEAREFIDQCPVKLNHISAPATQHDLLYYKSPFVKAIAYIFACLWGWNTSGWFMMIELEKRAE